MDAHYEALMVKVTDNAASPAEREERMTWLADKPEHRVELEKHQALKAVTDGWMARLEADLFEDKHQAQTTTRWLNNLGVALVVLSIATMMGFAFFQTMTDPNAPLAIQLGIGGLSMGSLVLLIAVIRWRLQARKSDRYTEVIR